MSASSLSLAATATAIAAGSTSSSTSLSLCNNIFYLSFDHLSLTFHSKPIKFLKLKTPHYSNFTPFSRFYVSRFSAAFDSFELAQETHNAQAAETEVEQELLKKVDDDDDEEGEGEAIESQSAEARRLYVGNLPYSMTSSQLADIFGEAGHVTSVEIVYDRVTDRSRGFGFVTMGSVQEAKEAIRLFDGSQVGGRTVKVNFPEVPRGGERAVMAPKIRSSYQGFVDSPHKIYAGNLSWGLTSQGLKEAFEDQPGLLSAKVIYDRDSGRSRGFGFVTFSSSEDVQNALNAMNGVELEGRPLRLNLAAERACPSSPASVESESENRLEDSELLSSITS